MSGQASTEYAAWKGWDAFLTCDAELSEYFDHEFRGVTLAGASLLEVGFGAGALLGWAQRRGAHVAGAEIDAWALDAARAAGVRVLDGALPQAARGLAEHFDIIAAFDVFEHLERAELRAHLEACGGALRPGGVLVMRYPNGQSPLGRAPQYGDATHRSVLSGEIVTQLAQGLPLATVRYGGAYRTLGAWGFKRVARLARYAAQDAAEALYHALYGQSAPLAPVVTHVMRREPS